MPAASPAASQLGAISGRNSAQYQVAPLGAKPGRATRRKIRYFCNFYHRPAPGDAWQRFDHNPMAGFVQ
jgi:hypothetical protein